MRWILTSVFWATCSGGLTACDASSAAVNADAKLTYPDTRRSGQIDDYHGEKVADPYRWLEDLESPETKAWVQAENKLTFGFLEQIPQ